MSLLPVAGIGPWLDTDEQAAWRRLLRVHARLVDRLDRELHATHGFGLGDYEVLVHLSEAPDGALRMSDLAARLSLSPSGLTRRVDSLVRRGLVRRKACESDGRGAFAALTDAGLDTLHQAAPTHVAGVRRYLVNPLGPAGVAALSRGLVPIEAALD
jgi:DNA-binding MarR family transcriptional regulator